jgi:hypothetical protein
MYELSGHIQNSNGLNKTGTLDIEVIVLDGVWRDEERVDGRMENFVKTHC